ncbi:MAG: tRNA epoxyqueuosine(34) reductase QueG [Planctomycetota bacterium]|nr:tRNA epoxyqueuosine(34) reductase QueG [Planctomycetota bacterium]
MTPIELTAELKKKASNLGFQLTACCPAVTPSGIHQFHEWIERGYAGTMDYLPDRKAAYAHPKHVMPGVRSLLVMAMHYGQGDPADASMGSGKVARYAWGSSDYHDVIHDRLKILKQYHQELVPEGTCRGVVDTAPLCERDFAQMAGLGWIGKNTLLIHLEQGSYFFLSILLSSEELQYDSPQEKDHCGTCTACLDQCPTNAFPEPFVLDATKCISYLTIEHRGVIPDELKPGMGDWVFGCDICQDVCPWNHRGAQSTEKEFAATSRFNRLDLPLLFEMDDEVFRRTFRTTPLWRARRDGILRNAAIALGNQKASRHLDVLRSAAQTESPAVQDACRWAIAQIESVQE